VRVFTGQVSASHPHCTIISGACVRNFITGEQVINIERKQVMTNISLSRPYYKINDGSIFYGDTNHELAEKWDELVLNSLHPNIFLTWAWVFIWVKWFVGNKRLNIIEVWDDLHLIGILPLYIGSVELFPRISVRGLKYIGDGDVVFPDYLGPIIRKGRLESFLVCLEEVVASNKNDYRLMELADMNLSSDGSCCLVDVLCKRFQCDIKQGDISPYIQFSGDYSTFLAGLDSKRRNHIKRMEKKALNRFQVRLECYQDKDKVNEAFEIMVQVFRKATRGQDKAQGFMRKDYLGFHQDVASTFAKNGWLRIYVLYFNDIPVAYLYGYLFDKGFWFYQTSYDLTFRDYSPGAVALQMVIKSVIDEGAKEFDFLRGDEEYKLKISDGHRQLTTAFLFKHNSYEYLLYRLGRNINHMMSSIKKYLKTNTEKSSLKPTDRIAS
jgi:hypothetical protein